MSAGTVITCDELAMLVVRTLFSAKTCGRHRFYQQETNIITKGWRQCNNDTSKFNEMSVDEMNVMTIKNP